MSLNSISIGMHVLNNSWNPNAPGHSGITSPDLVQLAANAGSTIIRSPLDLSKVSASGIAAADINYVGEILAAAAQNGIKVIFEPGQTPLDLLPSGSSVSDEPATYPDLVSLAQRYAMLVETIHTTFPQYASVIEGWEVGNEPNLSYQYYGNNTFYGANGDPNAPRFWVVGQDNAQYYAEFLANVASEVASVEQSLGYNIQLIGAGIAHNDHAYMERMFQTLDSVGAQIDAFAVHPYTFYSWPSPQSGRPTDWIPTPNGVHENDWDYYHSFQGALYSVQGLANQYGYGNSELYVTEFGVPSYLGYRNAGPAGRIDQAYWVAEALGVFDSWGNDNLKAVVAHMVLDTQTADVNDQYNAFDNDPNTPDGSSTSDSEGAFAFFERLYAGGPIVEKPVVGLYRAISEGQDFSSSDYRVISQVTSNALDISTWGTNGVGYLSGYVVLTHDGDDLLTGSAYDDSLFSGDGNDTVSGGDGNDRIYGGSGNDTIYGGDGDDDIYGNQGDDLINAGADSNRVDGGTGSDTLVLDGAASDYSISGDGRAFSASTTWQTTYAINVEKIYYTSTGSTVVLANGDTSAGNGGASESNSGVGGGNSAPVANNDTGIVVETQSTTTVDVLANDFDANGDPLTVTQINGADFSTDGWTGYINGVGLIQRNADNSLTIHSLDSPIGNFSFTYTVSDGSAVSNATVNGTVVQQSGGGTNTIYGTANDDLLDGTTEDDIILAGDGNDTLYGDTGDDVLDGQGGSYNQADYDGFATDYSFIREADGSISVSHPVYGTDTLKNIDGIWFYGEEAWYDLNDLAPDPNIYVGTGHDDYFGGTSGNDLIQFTGGTGNYVDADTGDDTVIFAGNIANYEILGEGDHFTVSNTVNGDAIQFTNVEYISFNDATSLSLDDIVANSSYDPGDTWYDPEPIGGLV